MNSETILNAVKELLPNAKSIEVDVDGINFKIFTLIIEFHDYKDSLSIYKLSKALNLPNLTLDVVSATFNKTILTFNF